MTDPPHPASPAAAPSSPAGAPDPGPTPATAPAPALASAARAETLAESVRRTLTDEPQRWLSPKWFYDDLGSVLFDAITRLPEYYPTRRERAILQARATEIATASGADTLVELGSGTSEKTRLLLDAFTATGQLRRFCPLDVSGTTLAAAAEVIAAAHPGLEVHPVEGDFLHDLDRIPAGGRRLVVFLGGTIGNLTPEEQGRFLDRVSATLAPGDGLLLGTDLVKDVERLLAAYDDAVGVTAAFDRNVLAVLNRELGADFDLPHWRHESRWDAERERVEMHLVAAAGQLVHIPGAGLEIKVEEGESIQTEISSKFRVDRLPALLAPAGFDVASTWTDPDGDFALTLAVRR
ncbi:MAG TPA: L-histidine N(alpha)-methyltransferase [Acidimicrobiales bacterium]|nr:L-histidine N(alpha)-methyltransferase [Acidimicrobiales bacterium]